MITSFHFSHFERDPLQYAVPHGTFDRRDLMEGYVGSISDNAPEYDWKICSKNHLIPRLYIKHALYRPRLSFHLTCVQIANSRRSQYIETI